MSFSELYYWLQKNISRLTEKCMDHNTDTEAEFRQCAALTLKHHYKGVRPDMLGLIFYRVVYS